MLHMLTLDPYAIITDGDPIGRDRNPDMPIFTRKLLSIADDIV